MSELPKGWSSIRLDEIVNYNPKHSKDISDTTPVSFVPMTVISENSVNIGQHEQRPLGQIRKGYTHFANGDVIIAKITPCFENGKAAIASNLVNDIGCGTTELHVLRPTGAVLKEYLYHYLHREQFINEAKTQMTGTAGQLRVPSDYLKNVELPLAPLNEQKRIVAKLDELLPKVEACKERLQKIPTILKRFRQSVLAAAVSGKLTEEWRKNNNPKITVEERIHCLKQARLLLADKGEVKNIDDWYSKSERIAENAGWINIPAGAICDFITKGTTPKAEDITGTGDVPFLKVYHIIENKINFSYKPTFVSKEINDGHLRRSRVSPGDVLMNIVGPPLNKAAVVPNDYPEWNINQALAIFRPISGVLSDYIQILLCQEAVLGDMIRETRGIVGQVNISLEQCRNIKIPLPPLEEQYEIVQLVGDFLLKQVKHLNAVETASRMCHRTEDSVLAKAFSGSLVSQDPTDEPASALLERIKLQAHQNNGKPTTKTSRKSKKTKAKEESQKSSAEARA